ncbi:MAG: hypothetical protein QOJ13_314 [Gaiellales bacterium]|jgi:uncharacterized protein YqhQ|nr:hypothetical protein [Gaiellales bacterium]MDX6591118.1 hypothetical protein [Gaiellales bacterium]
MGEAYTRGMTEDTIRLGGMALRNGILVQSLHHWAAAVRTPDGEVRIASGRKPELPERLLRVPGLRGVARVAEIGYLLPIVRRRLPEARLPVEGAGTAGALAATIAIGQVLRRSRISPLSAELLGAGLSLLPALASLRGSQVAGYHGAEHKAIGGYEQHAAAVDAAKEHDRCGSHMVGPMLAATVAGNVLVHRLPAHRRGPARVLAGIAAVGVATEVFGWMTRHADHKLSRLMRRPGYELQRVAATREPTADELEVAEVALDEVLRLEGAERLPA